MNATTKPPLSALIAAVRAHEVTAVWASQQSDDTLAEVVRTAKNEKGAVWLASRVAGPERGADKRKGQALTALRCLQRLADRADTRAIAALTAWEGVKRRKPRGSSQAA